MQLALFDIQTDDAAPKGKAGKVTGKTSKAAAGGTNKATQNTGDDFMASLRMVSKRKQENPEDIPAATSGSGQTPDGEHLARLGDILNEIMREWPTGKRPIGIHDSSSELPDTETSDFSVAEVGRGKTSRTGKATAIPMPGKGRQGSARVWQATAGFTTALIKHLSRTQNPEQPHSVTGKGARTTAEALNLNTTVADKTALPQSSPGKGKGISILNMAAVQPARAESISVKGAVARSIHKDDAATEKSATRQPVADRKGEPRAANGRTASLKTAGENAAWEVEKNTAASLKPKTARSAINENLPAGNRSAVKEAASKDVPVDSKIASEQNRVNDMKLSGRTSSPAAATPIQKGPVEGVTVFKPEVGRFASEKPRVAAKSMPASEAAAERAPDSKPAGGEQAVRFTPVSEGVTRFVKETGNKRKGTGVPKISDRREEGEDLRRLTNRESVKSPASIERKGLLNSDANLADKGKFGIDSTSGQAARDQKGVEQPRFEGTETRVKPADTVVPAPKSSPGAPVAAAPELDKPMLDRVARARVLEQITAKIKMQPKKGGSEIRIHLKPEALGQVQLKVLAQDQSVTVKMVAETVMARDIIEHNIGQLRADLNALGLNVEKLVVDVFTTNDPGERHSAGQHGSHTGNGRGAADHESRDGDLSNRVRQLHADADEADGSTLIGVFA